MTAATAGSPAQAAVPGPAPGPAPVVASAAVQAATAQAARHLEAVEKMRSRAETAAKSLLGFGGVALSALGITQATELVPQYLDEATTRAVVAVVVGVVLVGVAVIWLSRRLWWVNTPVVTTSDLEETIADLHGEEKVLVTDVYRDMARLNDAPSLRAYEARAWRLARIAARAEDERRDELLAQADVIRAEVRATHARAGMLVVRHRATKVLVSKSAIAIAGLFVTGLVALAGGAGFLADARYDAQIATSKACADARTAITTSKAPTALPEPCGMPPDAAPPPASNVAQATQAETRRVGLVLSELVRACFADANQPPEVCRARADDLTRVQAPG